MKTESLEQAINNLPATIRRNAFLQGRLNLKPVLPRGHKIVADRPQDKPRQAGPGRGRSPEVQARKAKRIAATARPLPLAKRRAKLAAMCRAAGVRNAAGLSLKLAG